MSRLCPDCREKADAWLDYRLPTRSQFTNHAAYDDTGRGVRDRHNGRFQEWKRTVRHARRVIADACAKNHGGDE